MPDGRAGVTYTIREEKKVISAEEWKVAMLTTVAMKYESWAQIQATIEKLCSEHRALCTKEDVKVLKQLRTNIDSAARRFGRHQFKMDKVPKSRVTDSMVPVPVPAPSQFDSHVGGKAHDVSTEVD